MFPWQNSENTQKNKLSRKLKNKKRKVEDSQLDFLNLLEFFSRSVTSVFGQIFQKWSKGQFAKNLRDSERTRKKNTIKMMSLNLSPSSALFSTCLALVNKQSVATQKPILQDKSLKTEDDIRIAWFSGTGNTLRAVKAMESTFKKAGKQVTLFPIEKSTPKDFTNGSIAGKTAFGLAFPVTCEVYTLYFL